MRVYSDVERVIEASRLSSNGHHDSAARIFHDMGNEVRNPEQKQDLWKMAEDARRKGR